MAGSNLLEMALVRRVYVHALDCLLKLRCNALSFSYLIIKNTLPLISYDG